MSVKSEFTLELVCVFAQACPNSATYVASDRYGAIRQAHADRWHFFRIPENENLETICKDCWDLGKRWP